MLRDRVRTRSRRRSRRSRRPAAGTRSPRCAAASRSLQRLDLPGHDDRRQARELGDRALERLRVAVNRLLLGRAGSASSSRCQAVVSGGVMHGIVPGVTALQKNARVGRWLVESRLIDWAECAAIFRRSFHARVLDPRRRQDRRADLRIARRIRRLRGPARRRRRRRRASRWCARTAAPNSRALTPRCERARQPSRSTCAQHPADAVISEPAYYCNRAVAEAARTRRRSLLRPDRGRRGDARRARASPPAPRSAFVPQCGLAPGFISIAANELITALRRAAQREAARRRPAPAPEQRAQVLADLVHRRPDQRVRQSLRGHRATAACVEVAPLEGLEEIEIDGTLLRGLQHLGRPRLARRDLRRAAARR